MKPGAAPTGADVAPAALESVARRRFGQELAPAVVEMWQSCNTAFQEFPFHAGVVYSAPLQNGPSNLLWAEPTGYRGTMVGFPYDDLDRWRGPYPVEVFIEQLEKVATGSEHAMVTLEKECGLTRGGMHRSLSSAQRALLDEMDVAEAAAIHWQSVANQARFVRARQALAKAAQPSDAEPHLAELKRVLKAEIELSRRLTTCNVVMRALVSKPRTTTSMSRSIWWKKF